MQPNLTHNLPGNVYRAESSITFSDVTVVINSCRVNVASFDPINNMPQLGPQVQHQGAQGTARGGGEQAACDCTVQCKRVAWSMTMTMGCCGHAVVL